MRTLFQGECVRRGPRHTRKTHKRKPQGKPRDTGASEETEQQVRGRCKVCPVDPHSCAKPVADSGQSPGPGPMLGQGIHGTRKAPTGKSDSTADTGSHPLVVSLAQVKPGMNGECPGTGWRRPRHRMEEVWKSPDHTMVLRPHCCCRCPLGCCLAPPTQGEPVPARCGHAPPWPALLRGPMHEQAPAPRNMAVPKGIVLSPGIDEAALNPASLDGPAGPCRGG